MAVHSKPFVLRLLLELSPWRNPKTAPRGIGFVMKLMPAFVSRSDSALLYGMPARVRSVPSKPTSGLLPGLCSGDWLQRMPRTVASGVTLRIYNTGAVHTKGAAVSSLKSWSSKVQLDEPFFAVKHPDQGVVLFDLGLTSESVKPLNAGLLTGLLAKFVAFPKRDAASQLKADGVDPESVKWIILSHLHLDHTGDLLAFPKATIVVSKREWEDARTLNRQKSDSKFLDPQVWEPRLRLRLVELDGEPPYGAFDHGLDLSPTARSSSWPCRAIPPARSAPG